MKTITILAIALIGISTSVRSADDVKKEAEKSVEKAVEAKKIAVKNAMVFAVPEKYQKLMELKTEKLAKDEKGSIIVPNAAIQKIEDKTVVLLSLEENKFALRFIDVVEKQDKNSLVKKNLAENELVVTNGSDKLNAGVIRIIKTQQHKGHRHSGSCNH